MDGTDWNPISPDYNHRHSKYSTPVINIRPILISLWSMPIEILKNLAINNIINAWAENSCAESDVGRTKACFNRPNNNSRRVKDESDVR